MHFTALQFITNIQEKISGNRNCSIIMCFRYFWYLLTRQVHLLKSQQKRMTRVKPKITWVHSDDAVAPSSISNAFRHHHAHKEQLENNSFGMGRIIQGWQSVQTPQNGFPSLLHLPFPLKASQSILRCSHCFLGQHPCFGKFVKMHELCQERC